MRALRRARWTTLLVVRFAVHASPALAAGLGVPANEQLSATGSLTYSWQGDQSRGCAAEGMCGVHGALILSPVGFGEVNSFGRGAMVSLEVAGTVRVRHDTGESGSGGSTSPSRSRVWPIAEPH